MAAAHVRLPHLLYVLLPCLSVLLRSSLFILFFLLFFLFSLFSSSSLCSSSFSLRSSLFFISNNFFLPLYAGLTVKPLSDEDLLFYPLLCFYSSSELDLFLLLIKFCFFFRKISRFVFFFFWTWTFQTFHYGSSQRVQNQYRREEILTIIVEIPS